MSVLEFDADLVRKLVDHAAAAPDHRPSYGQPKEAGLLLVGDQGVYLMSTGIPHLQHPDKKKDSSLVVYAKGINPELDAFDDWWDMKRATFGGDDGADTIPLGSFQAALKHAGPVRIEITTNTLGVLVPIEKKAKKTADRCHCGATGRQPCRTKTGGRARRHKGRTA